MSSSDWSFNLRTLHPYDSEDSDSEFQPTGVSEETQLLKDLDLSSRQESVNYKPNPWNIAKVNAASRPNKPSVIRTDGPILAAAADANASGVASKKKLKSPKGRIVDSFKKQAKRPSATTDAKLKCTAVLKPVVQTSVFPPVRSTDSTRKAQARGPSSPALHINDNLTTRTNSKKLNHPSGNLSSSSLPIASNSVLHQPTIRRHAILSPRSPHARLTKTSISPSLIPVIANTVSKENVDVSALDSLSDQTEETRLNLVSHSAQVKILSNAINTADTSVSTANTPDFFPSEPSIPAPSVSVSASYPCPIPIAVATNSRSNSDAIVPFPFTLTSNLKTANSMSKSNSNTNGVVSTCNSTSSFNTKLLTLSFSSPGPGPAPARYPYSNAYTSTKLPDTPSPPPSRLHQRTYAYSYSSPVKPSNESSTFAAFAGRAASRGSFHADKHAIWSGDAEERERDPYMLEIPPDDSIGESGEKLDTYMRAQSLHRSPKYAPLNFPRGNILPTSLSTVIPNAYSCLNASPASQYASQLQSQSQPGGRHRHNPNFNHSAIHNVSNHNVKRLQSPFPLSSVNHPLQFHPWFESTPFIEDDTYIQSFPDPNSNAIPSIDTTIYRIPKTNPEQELERQYNPLPSMMPMPAWLAAAIPARPVAALMPVPPSLYETAALPSTGPTPAAASRRVYNNDVAQYRAIDLDMDVNTQTRIVLPLSQDSPTRSARGRSHYRLHSPTIAQTNNKRRLSWSRSSSPTRPHFPNTSSQLQVQGSPLVFPKDLHPTHPRPPPLHAIQHRRIDAYDTHTDRDPDAEWSTLPSRKKTKTTTMAKQKQQLGIKQPGKFRMTMLVGGVGTGAGAGKTTQKSKSGGDQKRRVVKYLPPPMVKGPNPNEVNEDRADVGFQEPDDSKMEKTQMRMEDIEKMKDAKMDMDDNAGLQDADVIPHGRQQQITQADSDDYNNAEQQEDDSQSSFPAPHYSSPTLVDSSSPRGSDISLSVRLDDIVNNYPRTRMLMSGRKRAAAKVWEMLDLDSCIMAAIYREPDLGHSGILAQPDASPLGEVAGSLSDHHRRELPIVVWAGSR